MLCKEKETLLGVDLERLGDVTTLNFAKKISLAIKFIFADGCKDFCLVVANSKNIVTIIINKKDSGYDVKVNKNFVQVFNQKGSADYELGFIFDEYLHGFFSFNIKNYFIEV